LNGEVVDVDAPEADVSLRLDRRVLERLLQVRLHLADRVTVHLSDEPDPIGRHRLSQLGFSAAGEVHLWNAEPLRVEADVLLGQIDRRLRQPLPIARASRSDQDVQGEIVEAGDINIKPVARARPRRSRPPYLAM
jgi:hypothetical protein